MLFHASEYLVKEMLCIYVYTVQAVFNEIFPWAKETALTRTKQYEVPESIFTFFSLSKHSGPLPYERQTTAKNPFQVH